VVLHGDELAENGFGRTPQIWRGRPSPFPRRFIPPNFTGSTGWRILIASSREIAAVDFGFGFTPPRGVDETAAGQISSSAW
jgi:hypothetical protein